MRLNIAVAPEVLGNEELSDLGEVKLLCCVLEMLVSDMETIITLTNWASEVAVMMQDQNLMRVCRDYYDNPLCCTEIK